MKHLLLAALVMSAASAFAFALSTTTDAILPAKAAIVSSVSDFDRFPAGKKEASKPNQSLISPAQTCSVLDNFNRRSSPEKSFTVF
ncbi:MAG TPA: hypothetical protein VF599_04000 [Pyrinomonadaceae bacterium]|jgi:hypothetical protein